MDQGAKVLLLLLLAPVCSAAPPESLRFTQILSRHGDRTPTEDFPNNPYGPEAWPNGFQQLTQLGMRQTKDLGRFLRERYDGFLNSTYVAEQIYVRSSDKDRTLMSAAAVLAGLYPPQGFQQWDTDINWQPIPVHTRPIDNDIEMTVDVDCDLYSGLYVDALLSEDAENLYNDNKEMIEYVSEKAGWELPLLPNVWDTYDPLYCMKRHPELGFVFPEWLTPEIYQWLGEINLGYYHFKSLTPRMRYIRTGPFFRMLTGTMLEVQRGEMSPPGRRVMLYSSHDSMQASVLIALGVWNELKPPYAAAILFELHEKTPQEFTVQIYYKNDTVSNVMGEPVMLTVPGCDADCPLEKFLELMAANIYKGTVQEWREECNNQTGISGGVVAVTVLAVCLVPLVLAVLCYLIRRRRRPAYESV